jgi:hypothetical protein
VKLQSSIDRRTVMGEPYTSATTAGAGNRRRRRVAGRGDRGPRRTISLTKRNRGADPRLNRFVEPNPTFKIAAHVAQRGKFDSALLRPTRRKTALSRAGRFRR